MLPNIRVSESPYFPLPGAALALAALLGLAGCGGGVAATPKAVASAPSAASPSRTAIGKGTLSLKFPAHLQHASGVVRAAAAGKRAPAYVNPTAGNVLDIYVDGTLVLNLDGQTPNDSVTIAQTADGSQTIGNVPLYSTTSDVAVVERSYGGYILALGEVPYVSVTAGGTTNLTLTMMMNATGYAITMNANGIPSTETGNNQTYYAGTAGAPFDVYIYPTDVEDDYIAGGSGYGGLPTNISVTGSAGDGSKIGLQPLGFYQVSFASNASSLPVSASAPNPAYFIGDYSDYPQLNAIYQTNPSAFSTVNGQDYVGFALAPPPVSTGTQAVSCAYPVCPVPLPSFTTLAGTYNGSLNYTWPEEDPFGESLQFANAVFSPNLNPPIQPAYGKVYAVVGDTATSGFTEYFFPNNPTSPAVLFIPTLPATPVTVRMWLEDPSQVITPICTSNYPANTTTVTPSGGSITFTSPFDPTLGTGSVPSGCDNYWASSTGVGFQQNWTLLIAVTDS